MGKPLAIVVSAIGRQSETYIADHISRLSPDLSVVCAQTPAEAPSWMPTQPVMTLYRSEWRAVELARRVLSVTTRKGLLRLDMTRLGLWLARHRVEVVLCEYLPVAISVLDACRQIGIPVVAHAHGFDITAVPRQEDWAKVYAEKLPLMAEIVVVSNAMRDKVLVFGVDPSRVHVVPCGTIVDTDTPARVHQDKDTYKIVAVGRLIGKKGPIYLLESFRQICASGVRAELFVLGDGPFREPMQQFLRATRLDGCVHLLGERPHAQVRAELREADLFVQHSVTADDGDEEGLPVSILEGMAAGLPVVSTRHAGIPELVREGETGHLVEAGDSQGMAAAAVRLLSDPVRRTHMGAAARAIVASTFTIEGEVELLRRVLAKHCAQLVADHASAPRSIAEPELLPARHTRSS